MLARGSHGTRRFACAYKVVIVVVTSHHRRFWLSVVAWCEDPASGLGHSPFPYGQRFSSSVISVPGYGGESGAGPKKMIIINGEESGNLAGEQENGWRGPLGSLVSFFCDQRPEPPGWVWLSQGLRAE